MTNEERAAIKARADAATPGPWRQGYASLSCAKQHETARHPGPPECVYGVVKWIDNPHCVSAEDGTELCGPDDYGNTPRDADCAFIAHARTDVPALGAEVERLREALGFYANDFNWMARSNEIGERASDVAMRSPAMQDHGRRAQTALKDYGERYGQKAFE